MTIASESACGHDLNGAMGDFVAGPENRLAEVAIGDLLGQPGSLYSPMVLYGPSGAGKTHLALAVVARWKARPDRPPVKYAVAVDYARELAEAIETKTMDEFGVAYRRASLLVLEDLQHLAGRQAAQRELLQILDSLADDGACVLVTASRSPGLLDDMLPGLQSRLQAGLAVPVVLPGPAARAILFRRLAAARGIKLSESVIEFLAEKFSGAVPALDAALIELQMDGSVNMEAARRLLATRCRKDPSLNEIALATARHFSLRSARLAECGPSADPGRCARRGHVPLPQFDPRESGADRPLLRRPRPYHGLPRLPPDRDSPPDRTGDSRSGRPIADQVAKMSRHTGRTCRVVVSPACVARPLSTAPAVRVRKISRSDEAATAGQLYPNTFSSGTLTRTIMRNLLRHRGLLESAGHLSTSGRRIQILLLR